MAAPRTHEIGGLIIEHRPYTPAELIRLLRLDNRAKFWRAYERAQPRPVLQLGPKSIILMPDAVVAFVKFFLVSRETEAADRRRLADGRVRAD